MNIAMSDKDRTIEQCFIMTQRIIFISVHRQIKGKTGAIFCNMGKSGLPDIYTRSPRAVGVGSALASGNKNDIT